MTRPVELALDAIDVSEREAAAAALAELWPERTARLLGAFRSYSNRAFLVGHRGRRYVLRRYDLNQDLRAISYEHDLLVALPSHLGTARIARPVLAPRGQTAVDVDGRWYSAFPHLPGRTDSPFDQDLLVRAGAILGTYHDRARAFNPLVAQRHGYGTVAGLDWAASAVGGVQALWRSLASLRVVTAAEAEVTAASSYLASREAELREALLQGGHEALPHVPVHSDFGPQNLLVSAGRIVGLLDFDLVAWDARAYDLGVALGLLANPSQAPCRGWRLSADRSALVLRGYVSRVRPPLDPSELSLLPSYLRAMPLQFIVWALDRRLAGLTWYPEQTLSCLDLLRWLDGEAERHVADAVRLSGAAASLSLRAGPVRLRTPPRAGTGSA